MRPSVKYPLLTLLWAAVAAYVVWATGATQANRTCLLYTSDAADEY